MQALCSLANRTFDVVPTLDTGERVSGSALNRAACPLLAASTIPAAIRGRVARGARPLQLMAHGTLWQHPVAFFETVAMSGGYALSSRPCAEP
jgi:hypothetical protein